MDDYEWNLARLEAAYAELQASEEFLQGARLRHQAAKRKVKQLREADVQLRLTKLFPDP